MNPLAFKCMLGFLITQVRYCSLKRIICALYDHSNQMFFYPKLYLMRLHKFFLTQGAHTSFFPNQIILSGFR